MSSHELHEPLSNELRLNDKFQIYISAQMVPFRCMTVLQCTLNIGQQKRFKYVIINVFKCFKLKSKSFNLVLSPAPNP